MVITVTLRSLVDGMQMENTGTAGLKTAISKAAEPKTLAQLLASDVIKSQISLALPKHLTADRFTRVAITELKKNPVLAKCDHGTFLSCMMQAAALGLEIGVQGQAFLVPYNDRKKNAYVCTLIPGWKGLVDLVSRSGRGTVWTGAVFKGDDFDYALGDRPFVKHQPGAEDDPTKITHVYAIGRVNGSEWPVIEVWTAEKVRKHRDRYNKQGDKHYSFREWEMYARKVPLLQVIKYMPQSIELRNAVELDARAEMGVSQAAIDGDYFTLPEDDDEPLGNAEPTLNEVLSMIKNGDLDLAEDLLRSLSMEDAKIAMGAINVARSQQ